MRAPLLGVPLTLLAATLITSCFEDPVGPGIRIPPTGAVRLITRTTGDDLDPDGYELLVAPSNAAAMRMGANDSLVVGGLLPRNYEIRLTSVALNCVMPSGTHAFVVARDTIDVLFAGTCARLGTIMVTVVTTGIDPDPNGYIVTAAAPGFEIAVTSETNGTVPLKVLAGQHGLTLTGVAANCDVTTPNPLAVAVTSGGTAAAAFRVECAPVTRLAYSREGSEIFAIDSNGLRALRLSDGSATDADPAWSSDGTRIAFTSQPAAGNSDVYVMDADGSNRRQLTTHAGSDYRPAWSPDGLRIAFVSERDNNRELYVMDADGGNLVRLTNHLQADTDPAWSPDGRRIAFSSNRDGNAEIYVMNADGTESTRLTTFSGDDVQPAWSPQGDRIAFERRCGGTAWCVPDIMVMNADGSAPNALTAGQEPAWSADGRKIAYASYTCAYGFYYYYYEYYECEISGIRVIGTDRKGDTGVVSGSASSPSWRW